jgi:hypothetical protein
VTEADIAYRLDNWGRAMRVHPIRLRCRSLEGRWRSPQRNMWEAPVPALRGAVDMLDAWTVEHAAITLPRPDFVLLRLHYCAWPPVHTGTIRRVVRRYGRRNFGTFDAELLRAQAALEAALARSVEQNQTLARRKARQAIDFAIVQV